MARASSPGLQAHIPTGASTRIIATTAPVVALRIRTVRSSLVVASQVPSGEDDPCRWSWAGRGAPSRIAHLVLANEE